MTQPPVTGAQGTVLVPLTEQCGGRSRPVGAYAIDSGGHVTFVPAVDVQRLARYAAAGLAGATLAAVVTRGRGPSIGSVRMGPGGWVSLKGATPPRLLPRRRRRPWWARLLRARRLVAE